MQFHKQCLKRQYKSAKTSPIRFPRELKKTYLRGELESQGIFELGTVQWE